MIGLFYAVLLAVLRKRNSTAEPDLAEEALKNLVFVDSLPWFCGYFIVSLIALIVVYSRSLKTKPGAQ